MINKICDFSWKQSCYSKFVPWCFIPNFTNYSEAEVTKSKTSKIYMNRKMKDTFSYVKSIVYYYVCFNNLYFWLTFQFIYFSV